METEHLLTAEEAAEILGIKPGTLRNAMQEKRIPVVRLFGRRLLNRADVLDYKARTQPEGRVGGGRPRKQALQANEEEGEQG